MALITTTGNASSPDPYGEKSGVAGYPVSLTEMDDATSGLADSHESLYYRIR